MTGMKRPDTGLPAWPIAWVACIGFGQRRAGMSHPTGANRYTRKQSVQRRQDSRLTQAFQDSPSMLHPFK